MKVLHFGGLFMFDGEIKTFYRRSKTIKEKGHKNAFPGIHPGRLCRQIYSLANVPLCERFSSDFEIKRFAAASPVTFIVVYAMSSSL